MFVIALQCVFYYFINTKSDKIILIKKVNHFLLSIFYITLTCPILLCFSSRRRETSSFLFPNKSIAIGNCCFRLFYETPPFYGYLAELMALLQHRVLRGPAGKVSFY